MFKHGVIFAYLNVNLEAYSYIEAVKLTF